MRTRWAGLAGVALAVGLSGCRDEAGDGGYPTATVAVVVVPEVYVAAEAPGPVAMEYELEVAVLSNSGLPLAGAWVQVVADDCAGYGTQQTTTDEWGRAFFNFCVAPGSWVFIDVCSSGYACAAVDLQTGSDPYPLVPIDLPRLGVGVPP